MCDFDWYTIQPYKENLAEFENAGQWFGDLSRGKPVTHQGMPKASQIVQFWFRWGNLSYKAHGVESFGQLPAFVHDLMTDLGEPFCFACRIRRTNWDFKETRASKKLPGLQALYRHWNRLPLERAHIIPLSLGGSNRLRNFVLLCGECHRDAPDVADSSITLKWLQNRRSVKINQYAQDWAHACLQIDVDPLVVMRQYAEILRAHSADFASFQLNFSTRHFDTYSAASVVACIVAFAGQKGITGKE